MLFACQREDRAGALSWFASRAAALTGGAKQGVKRK